MSVMDDFIISLTLDIYDKTVIGDTFRDRLKPFGSKVLPMYGFSKSKVDAINKNVWTVGSFSILCTHSDDFIFTKKGFDVDIIEAFQNFSGLVHFPDGRVNEKLCTYPIMSKDYYDKFSYVYHPEYKSVFCDNEQTEVAKLLGQYKYVDKHIMQHQHYRAGYGQPDELMKRNDSPEMYEHDGRIYYERKANNFGLNLNKA